MPNKLSVILAASFALFICSKSAQAEDNLFKNYAYDSPLDSYTVEKGYYDCSEDVGGTARCIDDVDFIGNKFSAALVFSDGKLIMVSLFSPFDQALYSKALTTIAKTFTLVSMTDDKTLLDVLDLAATAKNQNEFQSKVANYESVGLSAGNLTYSFLEGNKVKSSYRNASSMLTAAPDATRSAELMLTGQGAEALLLVRFSYPKFEVNKARKASEEPAEAF